MYFNARWVDPELGRFAQADSIIPAAGDSQAWDRYAYGLNNPVRYKDSAGHCAEPFTAAICLLGGALLVAGATAIVAEIALNPEFHDKVVENITGGIDNFAQMAKGWGEPTRAEKQIEKMKASATIPPDDFNGGGPTMSNCKGPAAIICVAALIGVGVYAHRMATCGKDDCSASQSSEATSTATMTPTLQPTLPPTLTPTFPPTSTPALQPTSTPTLPPQPAMPHQRRGLLDAE
jgi:hypothetical protein